MGGSTSNKRKTFLLDVAHAIFTDTVFSQGCKQTFVKLEDARCVSFVQN